MKRFVKSVELLYRLNKKLFFSALILPVLTAAVLVTVLFMKFYPYQTLDITGTKVLTGKVRAGDNFIYQVSYCKRNTLPAKVARTLVGVHKLPDGSQNFIALPLVQTITHPGCATATIQLPIPQGSTSDTYYMSVDAEFDPNPLRRIHVTFTVGNFDIYH